ncbi:MAG: protein kinase [Candidatus Aminicenantes bacterium]|nr:protein kinase [Candidatus Aminicenantes bacterium]
MIVKCPKCQTENPDTKQFCADCGTQLRLPKDIRLEFTETLQTAIKELTTGATFAGRYQVIEELGKGGMGRVYKVFDTDIKEKVALKLLKPEIASDRETIERFSNELKYARKISHRNVCRMHDLGREAGKYFITMEYVSGEDLKSFIRRSRQLVVGTAIFIAEQVCEGLAEAHQLGVVHRDLKPSNIMIDKEGNAKIMDFGIARSISVKGITGAGVMIGTPEYMSPEQVEGKEVDQRSDIYSLGIIIYEMLTGQVPFEGDTPFSIGIKHTSQMPKSPKELNTQIPDDLCRVILKCMEKDRAKRYQSAAEVLSELIHVEKGLTTMERMLPEKMKGNDDQEKLIRTSSPSKSEYLREAQGAGNKESEKEYPHILFFPYVSVRFGFWAELVSQMAAQAFKNNMVFSIVAPDPLDDYDSASMATLLVGAENIIKVYQPDLIIMVPSYSRSFMDLFQRKFPEFITPLMTIDTEFYDYDLFKQNKLPIPPVIQVDNYEGGKLAAKMLLRDFIKGDTDPKFLVMPGIDDAPHSKARVRGFKEGIKDELPEARIRILPAGNFQREKAHKIMDSFCEDVELSKYKGIFCCNDEMALGVYTSLCNNLSDNLNFSIIGFNNTLEMQNYFLVDKRGWLKGTISQNLPEYVSTIIRVSKMLVQAQKVEPKYFIKPLEVFRP